MSGDIYVKTVDQQDARLGRAVVHDERSRGFALPTTIDKSTWTDKAVRMYDPIPNPNQTIGNCTGCAKAMEFNAVGNRVKGTINDMADADEIYSMASSIDPWPGQWPPDDTGSSGLAAAKAAQTQGRGTEYAWAFGGADQVVQIIMSGRVVNVGTWWMWDMFTQDSDKLVRPTGGMAGGHQYVARAYWKSRDWIGFRCWWGDFRNFWMKREEFNTLLLDDGDAHSQQVLKPAAVS